MIHSPAQTCKRVISPTKELFENKDTQAVCSYTHLTFGDEILTSVQHESLSRTLSKSVKFETEKGIKTMHNREHENN